MTEIVPPEAEIPEAEISSAATPEVLERARQLVEPKLSSAIDRLDEHIAPIARYHFGWVDESGEATPKGGGKGIRSALAVLSAEAVRADAEVGVPGAVAVELVHNFSLLHDDIIDGDTQRRHRPTVWALFSEGEAIIVGDALHALAFEVLLGGDEQTGGEERSSVKDRASDPQTLAAARLATATAAMIAGQSRDMAFNDRLDVTPQDCLQMEADKTGALLGYASSVGAVLAGADSKTVDALESYGLNLGLAFQAADDYLGIWGDPKATGKPVGNDLRERKKSYPVVVALSEESEASEELATILSKKITRKATQTTPLSEADIVRATELVELAGGKEAVKVAAEEHLEKAISYLQSVSLAESAVAEFTSLAHFVVTRDH